MKESGRSEAKRSVRAVAFLYASLYRLSDIMSFYKTHTLEFHDQKKFVFETHDCKSLISLP